MQWPDTFDGISAELMYIGIKSDNMNTLRQDTYFTVHLDIEPSRCRAALDFPEEI
jgi:hypothetical protein